MDIFIASAQPDVITRALDIGAVGVATNPTVVAEVGRPWRLVLQEAVAASTGVFLVQAVASDPDGICRDADRFREIVGDRLIVKVAMSPVAITAMRRLQRDGYTVMITTILTLAQGLIAAQAGADQLGIYVGRAQRAGIDPYDVIRGLRDVIDRRGLSTKIGVGSINDVPSLVGSALAGADNAAPTFKVLEAAVHHPLTESGLRAFTEDWNGVPSA